MPRESAKRSETENVMRTLAPPIPFGRDSIVYSGDIGTSLHVTLGSDEFNLPRLDVGPPGKPPDTIFYLNISPDPETEYFTPGLYEASVKWYEKQILDQRIHTLIIPPSHKSTEALREAVLRVNNSLKEFTVKIIELVGGKTTEDVRLAHPDFTEQYIPITTPGGKYIGMKEEDARYLSERWDEALQEGEPLKLWIGDDVVSTGETLSAIKKILGRATNGHAEVFVLVIAIERDEDHFPPEVDSHTIAAMSIVEISGGLQDGFVMGSD